MLINNYLNYIGSKDRYLPQILKFIESGAAKLGGSPLLIDMCCGSAVVGLNALHSGCVSQVLCVDACKELISMHNWVKQHMSAESLLADIDLIISAYTLDKKNKEGFLRLREDYNAYARCGGLSPRQLYALITHSFNYSLQTNKSGEFNVPFGKDKSCFNKSLRKKLTNWKNALDEVKNITFTSGDFDNYRDFTNCILFVDPPYSASISKHPYRIGNIKWTEEEDRRLFKYLDYMGNSGNLFIFTNATENNGTTNLPLLHWIDKHKYTSTPVSVDYTGCNYQRKNNGKTNEVIITNFKL